MKSLTWLLDCLLSEISRRCSTDTQRDKLTLSRRVKHEGISFITITLPNFATDFERSLAQGRVDSSQFLGFRKRGALPVFLRGLLNQVFDEGSGELLGEPSVEAILCVRQFCLMHKKVYLECAPRRVKQAYVKYGQVEHELAGLPERLDPVLLAQFSIVSGMLWSGVISGLDQEIRSLGIIPKHGPGATAEKVFGNQKYRLRKWHTRLEELFPFDWYGSTGPYSEGLEKALDDVEFVEPGAEQPVRVITVPKTLKSPRVIAIEPVCMQYIQQGIMEFLVEKLETCDPSRGHVNFTDQSINQSLAKLSSKTGEFATIDLSDASDRVHQDLVNVMLAFAPLVRDAVFACRSTRATLPDGTTYQLNKFASMGSALCFPIEAMVFFTLCVLARMRKANSRFTPREVYRASRRVYVYGDDIIVPSDEVLTVSGILEAFGLKVNPNKSFGTGRFRESCGMDAYDGVDVTPVYCRYMPPRDRHSTPELVSYVSLANQLYRKGWWATARLVRELVEHHLGELPHVQDTSPALGWVSVVGRYSITRWDKNTHSWKVQGYVVKSLEQDDQLDGHGALLKFFLRRGQRPFQLKHLERSVRPGCVRMKSRWVSPY